MPTRILKICMDDLAEIVGMVVGGALAVSIMSIVLFEFFTGIHMLELQMPEPLSLPSLVDVWRMIVAILKIGGVVAAVLALLSYFDLI